MNSTVSSHRQLQSLPPTETLEIGYNLSLTPRLSLLLTFFRSDPFIKPINLWQLKLSLLNFLNSSLSLPIPEDDLLLQKPLDPHKLKRGDPAASGTLHIRNFDFVKHRRRGDDEEYTNEGIERKFLDWRDSLLGRLRGMEVNLEGVKFRMSVEIPASNDYGMMKRLWEDCYGLQKG